MKRALIPALIAVAIGSSTAANAALTNFDIGDGTSFWAVDQESLDWNANGSGVAIGLGPFGTPFSVGTNFNFLYQANLVTVNPDGIAGVPLDTSADGSWNATDAFEYTIVARLNETVESFTALPGGLFAATFGLQTVGGSISIFYDEAGGGLNAKTSDGTGFDDGTEVLRMTVTPGTDPFETFSGFFTTSATTGAGTAKIYAELASAGDFVNADYLKGITDFIFDMEFQSNLNYPAGTSNTTGFHLGGSTYYATHAVTANDIVFKVDGDNRFSVPEPASLALLGIGLLGLAARRRKA